MAAALLRQHTRLLRGTNALRWLTTGSKKGQSATLEEMTEIVAEYARIDHGRTARTGLPEVVFGEGKTVEQIRAILLAMHSEAASYRTRQGGIVGMATRVNEDVYTALAPSLPNLVYHRDARICALSSDAEGSA